MIERKKLVMAACINLGQLNGPAIHLCSLVRNFIKTGYEVVLIIPNFDGSPTLKLPENLYKFPVSLPYIRMADFFYLAA
ncbi:MAG: hypothetical protein GY927_10145 [bacterium]|nr:hypothetical protein [bacterium]